MRKPIKEPSLSCLLGTSLGAHLLDSMHWPRCVEIATADLHTAHQGLGESRWKRVFLARAKSVANMRWKLSPANGMEFYFYEKKFVTIPFFPHPCESRHLRWTLQGMSLDSKVNHIYILFSVQQTVCAKTGALLSVWGPQISQNSSWVVFRMHKMKAAQIFILQIPDRSFNSRTNPAPSAELKPGRFSMDRWLRGHAWRTPSDHCSQWGDKSIPEHMKLMVEDTHLEWLPRYKRFGLLWYSK